MSPSDRRGDPYIHWGQRLFAVLLLTDFWQDTGICVVTSERSSDLRMFGGGNRRKMAIFVLIIEIIVIASGLMAICSDFMPRRQL